MDLKITPCLSVFGMAFPPWKVKIRWLSGVVASAGGFDSAQPPAVFMKNLAILSKI